MQQKTLSKISKFPSNFHRIFISISSPSNCRNFLRDGNCLSSESTVDNLSLRHFLPFFFFAPTSYSHCSFPTALQYKGSYWDIIEAGLESGYCKAWFNLKQFAANRNKDECCYVRAITKRPQLHSYIFNSRRLGNSLEPPSEVARRNFLVTMESFCCCFAKILDLHSERGNFCS